MPKLKSIADHSSRITYEEYPTWLASQGIILDKHKTHYETIGAEVQNAFSNSSFWEKAKLALREADAEYQIANSYPLTSVEPTILVKPWASFLEKTYRKNITNNDKYPNPPEDGWVLPENWFERIHDIVRTTVEVKYLDGVQIVLAALTKIAADDARSCASDLEARVDGYYGAHFQCAFTCPILDLNWKRTETTFHVEVQVTTAMKAVIKRLLHSYYEDSRMKRQRPTIEEISWNYNTGQFNAAYLGHILHYVEGMIIEVRKQQKA